MIISNLTVLNSKGEEVYTYSGTTSAIQVDGTLLTESLSTDNSLISEIRNLSISEDKYGYKINGELFTDNKVLGESYYIEPSALTSIVTSKNRLLATFIDDVEDYIVMKELLGLMLASDDLQFKFPEITVNLSDFEMRKVEDIYKISYKGKDILESNIPTLFDDLGDSEGKVLIYFYVIGDLHSIRLELSNVEDLDKNIKANVLSQYLFSFISNEEIPEIFKAEGEQSDA